MEFYRSMRLEPDKTAEAEDYDYEEELPAADVLKAEAKEVGD